MKLKILVSDTTQFIFNKKKLQLFSEKILNEIIKKKNTNIYELSLVFVDKKTIKKFKKKYFNKSQLTDVISFPQNDFNKKYIILGDIIICPEVAKNQADKLKIDFSEEIIRLIIHGMLHLYGFSDKTKITRKKMFDMQENILKKVVSGKVVSIK